MAEEMSFNKKMNSIKLLLSSLFARKQNWVVFNGDDPNTLIFTTVPVERIVFYRPDIDDQMSLVKVTDEGIKYLYELFPFFRSTCGVIFLPDFLSTVNKLISENKGVAPNVKIDLGRDLYIMDVPKSAQVGFDLDESGPTEVIVGKLISSDYYELYKQVFRHFNSFVSPNEVVEKYITLGSSAKQDKVVAVAVDLHNSTYDKDVVLCLPIQDGTNIVSFTEYLAKRKAEWKYRVLVQYNEKHSAAKAALLYKDDMVDVVSITPGSLWFPFRKKN